MIAIEMVEKISFANFISLSEVKLVYLNVLNAILA